MPPSAMPLSRRAAGLAALALAAAAPAVAQPLATRPMRLIIPFPPGAGTDATGRILAQKLAEVLGQPVVAENIVGANGLIATRAMATAAPDGRTLGLAAPGPVAIAQFLFSDMPYDPETDLIPVIGVNESRLALAVAQHVPARTLPELFALIRRQPGRINAANPTAGSVHHLMAELVKLEERLDFVLVPYRGGGPAMNDLVGGHVDMMFNSVSTIAPFAREGRVRALMVIGNRRDPELPDVPSTAELGLGYLGGSQWHGIVVPKGTPAATVAALHDALHRALRSEEVVERMARIGTEVIAGTTEEFASLLRAERARWGRVIRAANVKPD